MNIVEVESIRVLSPYKFEIVDTRRLSERVLDYWMNNQKASIKEVAEKFEITEYYAEQLLISCHNGNILEIL